MLFLMLFLLGIDSEFGTMEAAITPIFDANILPKWMKKYMFTGKYVKEIFQFCLRAHKQRKIFYFPVANFVYSGNHAVLENREFSIA